MNLDILSRVKYFLSWLFFSTDFLLTLHFHRLLVSLGKQDVWGWTLPVKTKVSKALNTSDFSPSLVISSPTTWSSGLTLPIALPLMSVHFSKLLLLPVRSFHYQMSLSFLFSLPLCLSKSSKCFSQNPDRFNTAISWSLQPRLPFMSATSYCWFVFNGTHTESFLLSFLATYMKKLPSIHSRNSLYFLCLPSTLQSTTNGIHTSCLRKIWLTLCSWPSDRDAADANHSFFSSCCSVLWPLDTSHHAAPVWRDRPSSLPSWLLFSEGPTPLPCAAMWAVTYVSHVPYVTPHMLHWHHTYAVCTNF